MKYQPVPMPENLFKTISETDSFTNKIQINHPNNIRFTPHDKSNDVNNSEDESYNKLDSSQQINYMESTMMFH